MHGQYASLDDDSEFIADVKNIVQTDFSATLTNSPLITLTSFLDPRFHGLIPSEHVQPIKDELHRKLHSVTSMQFDVNPTRQLSANNVSSSSTSSALSFFLGKQAAPIAKKPIRSRLHVEIFGYMEEVELEMDRCPLDWWKNIGASNYPNMFEVAKRYACVPAVIGIKKISLVDRMEHYMRRKGLSGELDTVDRSVWMSEDVNVSREVIHTQNVCIN